jgi:hypothetical protein
MTEGSYCLGYNKCGAHGYCYLIPNPDSVVKCCDGQRGRNTRADFIYDPWLRCLVDIVHDKQHYIFEYIEAEKNGIDISGIVRGDIVSYLVNIHSGDYENRVYRLDTDPAGDKYDKEFWVGQIGYIRVVPSITRKEYLAIRSGETKRKIALTFLCALARFAEKESLNEGACNDVGNLIISTIAPRDFYYPALSAT